MKSPVATHQPMEREILEKGLVAYHCLESGGIFLPADNYWRWISQQPERLPHLPAPTEVEPTLKDSGKAKICPETGALMQRYQVGHGFDFFIDRSPTGSIWLDAGEWEALKKRQFHDELHLIFTAPWQSKIQQQELSENQEERLIERLGSDLVDRLTAMRGELANHPDRTLALTFLNQT